MYLSLWNKALLYLLVWTMITLIINQKFDICFVAKDFNGHAHAYPFMNSDMLFIQHSGTCAMIMPMVNCKVSKHTFYWHDLGNLANLGRRNQVKCNARQIPRPLCGRIEGGRLLFHHNISKIYVPTLLVGPLRKGALLFRCSINTELRVQWESHYIPYRKKIFIRIKILLFR